MFLGHLTSPFTDRGEPAATGQDRGDGDGQPPRQRVADPARVTRVRHPRQQVHHFGGPPQLGSRAVIGQDPRRVWSLLRRWA